MKKLSRLCNGKIVTPNEIIECGTIVLEGDKIVEIQRGQTFVLGEDEFDADGMWILPGLIDTHSDAIEQEIQPRPSSVMPINSAFYELERKLAGQGITTMYHSLSLYYTENNGNWVRRNRNVEYIIKKIHELTEEKSLIRNKIHLRYEMRNIEGYSMVKKLIETNEIDQLSFMDHTPGKGQWHDITIQKQKIMKQLNLTSEEADKHIMELQNDTNIDFNKIQKLADLSFQHSIPVASHDDDSIDKMDVVQSWKASISEFPITLEIAEEAKKRGIHVVVGAPNLLIGGSHNKNLSSLEAIRANVVDVLCSDYYPGSLLQGIFYLYHMGFDLVEAVKLATLNPAKALGLAESLGSIEIGKKADLLLVSTEANEPKLFQTIVNGETVFQIHYRNHSHKSILRMGEQH